MPSLEFWYYFPSDTKYKREEFPIEVSGDSGWVRDQETETGFW